MKRLQTTRFQLHDILEKGKTIHNFKKVSDHQGWGQGKDE